MTAVLQNRHTSSTSSETGEKFFSRCFLVRVRRAETLSQFGLVVAYK